MAKKSVVTELYSYGIYSHWDQTSAKIPKLLEITTRIPCRESIEFGYVVLIKGAKGQTINYRIDHPPFLNSNGDVTPPFEGTHYISSNDYQFFLGDTVWKPIEDKAGEWTITTWLNDKVIATKVLYLFIET